MAIKRQERGFTLIELLVVISIIALLSSVILASLQSARQKAMAANAVSNLHQVTNALELLHDATNQYPDQDWLTADDSNEMRMFYINTSVLKPLVDAGYISKLPNNAPFGSSVPANLVYGVAKVEMYSYYSCGDKIIDPYFLGIITTDPSKNLGMSQMYNTNPNSDPITRYPIPNTYCMTP